MASSLSETLLLKQPAVSADEIAFLYAGDLWIAEKSGASARRLTAQKGRKAAPYFSPDGQWIAFSANYDGNQSVYVIPREGGAPRRLTYHPYEDWVRGWTADGSAVLFTSTHESISRRARRLFTVPLDGGLPELVPVPTADRGAFSPDGQWVAFWSELDNNDKGEIMLASIDGVEVRQLTHNKAREFHTAWSKPQP